MPLFKWFYDKSRVFSCRCLSLSLSSREASNTVRPRERTLHPDELREKPLLDVLPLTRPAINGASKENKSWQGYEQFARRVWSKQALRIQEHNSVSWLFDPKPYNSLKCTAKHARQLGPRRRSCRLQTRGPYLELIGVLLESSRILVICRSFLALRRKLKGFFFFCFAKSRGRDPQRSGILSWLWTLPGTEHVWKPRKANPKKAVCKSTMCWPSRQYLGEQSLPLQGMDPIWEHHDLRRSAPKQLG